MHAAIIYQMRNFALARCKSKADAFAQCCEGRLFSISWACRQQLHDLNACTKELCAPALKHFLDLCAQSQFAQMMLEHMAAHMPVWTSDVALHHLLC